MKLTLIRPCMGARERRYQEQRMEPLQLAVLASLTPPDVETTLFDERLESVRFDTPADLVAITVETFTARRAYEIADEYRLRGVPVILGGLHPTLVPEEAAGHADSVYTGDAEDLWGQVIEDARQGRLRPRYDARRGFFRAGLVTDRSLLKCKRYLPISLVQFGRGCPFNCTFCATGAFFSRHHECRGIVDVIDELRALDPRKFVILVDDNLVAEPKPAKEFFRLLKPLRLRWAAQVSANVAQDPELLELMAEAGCYGFLVGFESLHADTLLAMKKNQNLVGFDRYRRHVELFRQYGFMIWAAFTLGHDSDTLERIEETTEFAIENRFAFAAFNILIPYPGTRLYASLAEQGRLLYDGAWWLHPDYRFNYAAFRPQQMTADELTAAVFRAQERFYSYPSILRRGFDFRTNMGSPAKFLIHFPYNVMFRKTVYDIQGMQFGAHGHAEAAA
jgi:radical SAM superfamily enzyme YgiQ (UPF0313 family)